MLNTNFMRHDYKYSQSHLSAVRQRPDGSVLGQQQYNQGYHRKHYHHDDDEHNNKNNYNRYNKDRYYGSHSNSDEARLNLQNGATENGAIVSALSVSHESEKQWEWLEDTLAKSSRNKETVSKYIMLNILYKMDMKDRLDLDLDASRGSPFYQFTNMTFFPIFLLFLLHH